MHLFDVHVPACPLSLLFLFLFPVPLRMLLCSVFFSGRCFRRLRRSVTVVRSHVYAIADRRVFCVGRMHALSAPIVYFVPLNVTQPLSELPANWVGTGSVSA